MQRPCGWQECSTLGSERALRLKNRNWVWFYFLVRPFPGEGQAYFSTYPHVSYLTEFVALGGHSSIQLNSWNISLFPLGNVTYIHRQKMNAYSILRCQIDTISSCSPCWFMVTVYHHIITEILSRVFLKCHLPLLLWSVSHAMLVFWSLYFPAFILRSGKGYFLLMLKCNLRYCFPLAIKNRRRHTPSCHLPWQGGFAFELILEWFLPS